MEEGERNRERVRRNKAKKLGRREEEGERGDDRWSKSSQLQKAA